MGARSCGFRRLGSARLRLLRVDVVKSDMDIFALSKSNYSPSNVWWNFLAEALVMADVALSGANSFGELALR